MNVSEFRNAAAIAALQAIINNGVQTHTPAQAADKAFKFAEAITLEMQKHSKKPSATPVSWFGAQKRNRKK